MSHLKTAVIQKCTFHVTFAQTTSFQKHIWYDTLKVYEKKKKGADDVLDM
jgi:hypothetical protein